MHSLVRVCVKNYMSPRYHGVRYTYKHSREGGWLSPRESLAMMQAAGEAASPDLCLCSQHSQWSEEGLSDAPPCSPNVCSTTVGAPARWCCEVGPFRWSSSAPLQICPTSCAVDVESRRLCPSSCRAGASQRTQWWSSLPLKKLPVRCTTKVNHILSTTDQIEQSTCFNWLEVKLHTSKVKFGREVLSGLRRSWVPWSLASHMWRVCILRSFLW